MSKNYFQDLKKSDGAYWINNPTLEEMKLSLEQGAVSGTTNPAFCSRLATAEREHLIEIIDDVLQSETDIEKAANIVYQKATKYFMDAFMGVYEESGGEFGYVTIQSDPRFDECKEHIIADVEVCRKLSPNYMAKIPMIVGSVDAIEYCLENNIPVCVTEVFAISQMIHSCELYEKVAERTGNRPPYFVTHITGIFDEYFEKIVKRDNIDIAPEILHQAGLIIARKQYRLMKERGYPGIVLGGGARRMDHLTGMMGGDAHVTINWSTVVEVMESPVELSDEVHKDAAAEVIEELRAKLSDFRKAYDDDGLTFEEFAEFGPVQLFRNAFLKGWYTLLAEVAGRKNVLAI